MTICVEMSIFFLKTALRVTKTASPRSRKLSSAHLASTLSQKAARFTAEEVRLRQPVTEDDVKNLDPKMFPSAPSGPPPDLATGGGAPSSSVNWPRLPARPPQKGIHPLVLYGRPSSGVWVYDGHQCRRRGSARHPFQWGGI